MRSQPTQTNSSNPMVSMALKRLKTVKIELREDALPYAVHTARRVPFPMLQKVKDELLRMEQNGQF